ncbi:hypothetical protein ED733_006084 [Metarhizium rileyi]|uniref:Uncharacterized protein n=1 Tax=Metarhizium rileyi (strain RCEF 4871) TaxID=1649241 RepID=A0A5C6GM75_METRR|nr:hypothetical protein ED733_006084 [Metarhizium rileyi]
MPGHLHPMLVRKYHEISRLRHSFLEKGDPKKSWGRGWGRARGDKEGDEDDEGNKKRPDVEDYQGGIAGGAMAAGGQWCDLAIGEAGGVYARHHAAGRREASHMRAANRSGQEQSIHGAGADAGRPSWWCHPRRLLMTW